MRSNKAVAGNELLGFGPFRLDTRARLLLLDGIPVPLPPKSYDTLVYLVRRRGQTVSREELARQVWPDVVVSDGSLSQAVFVLRKALGDSEEGPRFIETVPRVGYRFTGEVEDLRPTEGSTPDSVARTSTRSRRALVAAVVVLAVVASGVFVVRRYRSVVRARSTGLMTVVREMPVAPDATRLLGHVETSSLLAAPGAYYIQPDDGAAATRIPLREGETPISIWDGALAILSGETLELRDPLKQERKHAYRLPPYGSAAPAIGWAASPDGRFLARRTSEAIEVLERRGEELVKASVLGIAYRAEERLTLGSRTLALARGEGDPLRVWTVPDGKVALEQPFSEFRVTSVAVDDEGRVALGGPFDEIQVFRVGGGAPLHIPRRGWTHGLAFVPDTPTLVASGYYGLAAFRDGSVVDEEPGDAASAAESVTPFAGGLLVFSSGRHRLALVSYAGAPPAQRVDAKTSVLWALEHDARGATVLGAGRDGKLYQLDVATSRVRSAAIHADGVPSLVRDGDFLASSSDDKTVAVWRLPGPTLVKRETGHRYLVNDLAIAPRGPAGAALVSSSSDGTLKIWSWPALELVETLDVEALTGRKSELHAVWTSPDLTRLLAGTWDGALLDIRRGGAKATARRLPVRASVVYKLAALPSVGLVAGVGHDPAEVLLFDLESGSLRTLDAAGLDVFWCMPGQSGNELVVLGNGGISRYVFERSGNRVRYTLVTRRQGGLWLTAATLLPDGSLWAGTADGAFVRYAPGFLAGPPSLPVELSLGD